MVDVPCFVGMDVANAPLAVAVRPAGERWPSRMMLVELSDSWHGCRPSPHLDGAGSHRWPGAGRHGGVGHSRPPRGCRQPAAGARFGARHRTVGQDSCVGCPRAGALCRRDPSDTPAAAGTPKPTNCAPCWHGGGNWSRCGRPNRIVWGMHPHGCRRTSRPISPGSIPGWRRWTTTSTRHCGRVPCGGSARSCCVASLGLVQSVPNTVARPAGVGTLSRQQLAALVGVAPLNRDSGTLRGRRTIWGDAPCAATLYMSTLVAVRYNPGAQGLL